MKALASVLLLSALTFAAGDAPRGTAKGHLNGADGKPAPGASVLLLSADGRTARGTTTSLTGFFVFRDLPGGVYQLLAARGAERATRQMTLRAPFAADEQVRLAAPAAGNGKPASAPGGPLRVTCAAGELSVPGAKVLLLAENEALNRGAVCDAEGVATLAAPAAPVKLVVEALGFRLFESAPFAPTAGLAVEIQLQPDTSEFPFEPRSHLPPNEPPGGAATAAPPASAPATAVTPTSAPIPAPVP